MPVCAVVLIVSLFFRNRLMLILGLLGATCGPLFVPPSYMDSNINYAQYTIIQWRSIGAYLAFLGCLDAWAWTHRPKKGQFQFTLRSGLILMLNVSAILAIIDAINV